MLKLSELPDGAVYDAPAPHTGAPVVGSGQRYARCWFCGKPTATYGKNSDTIRHHKHHDEDLDPSMDCPGSGEEGTTVPPDEEVWVSPTDSLKWVRAQ